MKRLTTVMVGSALVGSFLLTGCSRSTTADTGRRTATNTTVPERALTPGPRPAIRIAFVGDVMLGRGVASSVENSGDELFAAVRHLLKGADLSAANLESPLTFRPHRSSNSNQLEADPASIQLLTDAGFDLLSLSNNHSGDAGAFGVTDTLEAAATAGLLTVGAGANAADAARPVIVDIAGLLVGFLAFDTTGAGLAAGSDPGIAAWDPATGLEAVLETAASTDLVVVSLHGGTEYLPVTDPGLADIATELAAAGADVVWGHGAHVIQPILSLPGDRHTVVATSLGNFLFDQSGHDRTTGAYLEVMADADGVIAYRVAITEHPDQRVAFVDWLTPDGDAAWFDSSWWTMLRRSSLKSSQIPELAGFRWGDLTFAGQGDVTRDGVADIVASFRRPFRPTVLSDMHPEVQWQDAHGRSAHLGVFGIDFDEVWVAGTVVRPITELAACDGSIAVVHDTMDDSAPVASGAWTWSGFGFETAPELPGGGTPACADLNGDGLTEPVLLRNG